MHLPLESYQVHIKSWCDCGGPVSDVTLCSGKTLVGRSAFLEALGNFISSRGGSANLCRTARLREGLEPVRIGMSALLVTVKLAMVYAPSSVA